MQNNKKEAMRIINCASRMPMFHGSTTIDIVDEIIEICAGQIFCNGYMRNFVFTEITKRSCLFKTKEVS